MSLIELISGQHQAAARLLPVNQTFGASASIHLKLASFLTPNNKNNNNSTKNITLNKIRIRRCNMHGHYKCPQPFSTLLERQYIFLFKAITTGVKKSNGEKQPREAECYTVKIQILLICRQNALVLPAYLQVLSPRPFSHSRSHTHISCTSQGSDHNS